MGTSAGRSGHRWRTIRNNLKMQRNPCWICKQPIDYDAPANHPEAFEPDHYYPVSTHPHLANDPGNLRASHSECNRKRGNQPAQEDAWVQAEEW
ncbi:HNH endonuclease [Rhodococcus sp. MSC1_016]|jgi:5-methylcytosine-specific restriction endonuclease McrA|uniref:HNH endonuclease n=1 Tax=Rhodococcus sp. MSC1_016 TaxID=2909266 RepID=UPI00202F6713|nr:HNH endonuclease [Rhodococcus sp. MSC1_016]